MLYLLNNICSTSNMLNLFFVIKIFIKLVFNIVPLIIIITTMIALFKVVLSGKKEEMIDTVNVSVKKIIAGLVVFFIPLILSFAIDNLLSKGNVFSEINQCIEKADLKTIRALREKEETEEEAKRKVQKEQDDKLLREAYEEEQKQKGAKKQSFEEWRKKKEEEKRQQATPQDEVQTSGTANIYFLNTGSSDAIILESNGKFGLIDTSLASKSLYVIDYLHRLGAQELEFVLITHTHGDHIGGLSAVAKSFKINNFFIKVTGANSGPRIGTYSRAIKKAKSAGAIVHDVSSTSSFSLGSINMYFYNRELVTVTGVSPENVGRSENCNSSVMVATISGLRIYFAGDIGNYFGHQCESNAASMIGHVDIYKVAHHGYTSFNNHEDALRKISPEYSVITNASGGGYGTAASRLKNRKINPNYKNLFVTGNGTVKLSIQPDGSFDFSQ